MIPWSTSTFLIFLIWCGVLFIIYELIHQLDKTNISGNQKMDALLRMSLPSHLIQRTIKVLLMCFFPLFLFGAFVGHQKGLPSSQRLILGFFTCFWLIIMNGLFVFPILLFRSYFETRMQLKRRKILLSILQNKNLDDFPEVVEIKNSLLGVGTHKAVTKDFIAKIHLDLTNSPPLERICLISIPSSKFVKWYLEEDCVATQKHFEYAKRYIWGQHQPNNLPVEKRTVG